MKICSCFGHREIELTEKLKKQLYKIYEDLILDDFDTFYFGGFSMFDDLCYEVVSELKIKYPHIKRVFCVTDERYLRYSKQPCWLKETPFEEIIYLTLKFDWWYMRVYYRNIEMIEASDFVIFYVENSTNSKITKTFQYAKKKNKKYVNLAV